MPVYGTVSANFAVTKLFLASYMVIAILQFVGNGVEEDRMDAF
jgi:hypothetical protein